MKSDGNFRLFAFKMKAVCRILICKLQILYFCNGFWYDIGVERGVKYFSRNIACGKYAIYSARRIYVDTIYRVYPTQVGMSRPLFVCAVSISSLSHMRGNEPISSWGEKKMRIVRPTCVGVSRCKSRWQKSHLGLFHASGTNNKIRWQKNLPPNM